MKGVTFRTRVTLAALAAVSIAIVAAAATTYAIVRHELRDEIDDSLRLRVGAVARRSGLAPHGGGPGFRVPAPPFAGPNEIVQVVGRDGAVVPGSSVALPVSSATRKLLQGERESSFFDAEVLGVHLRIHARRLPDGQVVQIGRSLEETDAVLDRVRLLLIGVAIAGIAVAAVLGRFVASTALVPIAALSRAAERVAATRDLSERVDAGTSDELGRLAASFNAMMAALAEAERSQKQLVADASHELRTPLTSLRTNIEVLGRTGDLPEGERVALMRDVVAQLEELTTLVAELVDLSQGEVQTEPHEDVRLDLVVAEAVERARRRSPESVFTLEAAPTLVRGARSRLERAVLNLLDNAAKFSPAGTEITATVADGVVTVRDRGPGIDPNDLPHVLDRFYRAPAARSLPGSGLGLAIVKQVADEHDGAVEIDTPEGGGVVVRLRLPASHVLPV